MCANQANTTGQMQGKQVLTVWTCVKRFSLEGSTGWRDTKTGVSRVLWIKAVNKAEVWKQQQTEDWRKLLTSSYLSVNVQIFPSNNCKTFCKQLCQDLTNPKCIFWAVPANNLLNIDLGLTHYCFLTPKEAILYHFTFPKFTYIISQGFFQCAVVILHDYFPSYLWI